MAKRGQAKGSLVPVTIYLEPDVVELLKHTSWQAHASASRWAAHAVKEALFLWARRGVKGQARFVKDAKAATLRERAGG